jgi:hypothetical protein
MKHIGAVMHHPSSLIYQTLIVDRWARALLWDSPGMWRELCSELFGMSLAWMWSGHPESNQLSEDCRFLAEVALRQAQALESSHV